MPEGVFLVGFFCGKLESENGDYGASRVGQVVYTVRNDGDGACKKPGNYLRNAKQNIYYYTGDARS